MPQTEELHIPKQGSERSRISPALATSFPEHCFITDESFKEARLSSAGYILHFGKTYQLRAPASIKKLSIVGYPNHRVKVHPPGTDFKHNVEYRYVPFRVAVPGWLERLTHHGSYPYELEWEATFADDRRTNGVAPVVLQKKWSVVLLIFAILFALAVGVYNLILDVTFGGRYDRILEPKTWIWAFITACLYPLVLLPKRWWTLSSRAADLRRQFDAKWGPTTRNAPASDSAART